MPLRRKKLFRIEKNEKLLGEGIGNSILTKKERKNLYLYSNEGESLQTGW